MCQETASCCCNSRDGFSCCLRRQRRVGSLQLADEAWKSLTRRQGPPQSSSTPPKGFLSCLSEADSGRSRSLPGLPASAFLSAPGRKTQRPFVAPAKRSEERRV